MLGWGRRAWSWIFPDCLRKLLLRAKDMFKLNVMQVLEAGDYIQSQWKEWMQNDVNCALDGVSVQTSWETKCVFCFFSLWPHALLFHALTHGILSSLLVLTWRGAHLLRHCSSAPVRVTFESEPELYHKPCFWCLHCTASMSLYIGSLWPIHKNCKDKTVVKFAQIKWGEHFLLV